MHRGVKTRRRVSSRSVVYFLLIPILFLGDPVMQDLGRICKVQDMWPGIRKKVNVFFSLVSVECHVLATLTMEVWTGYL